MKIYARSESKEDRILRNAVGRDIWLKCRGKKYAEEFWIKILSETSKYYYVIKLYPYDKGDYAKLKITNPDNEFTEMLSKSNLNLYPKSEILSGYDILDEIDSENPEGYSLDKNSKGKYYWHWDGDRPNPETVQYDMPIGSI